MPQISFSIPLVSKISLKPLTEPRSWTMQTERLEGRSVPFSAKLYEKEDSVPIISPDSALRPPGGRASPILKFRNPDLGCIHDE